MTLTCPRCGRRWDWRPPRWWATPAAGDCAWIGFGGALVLGFGATATGGELAAGLAATLLFFPGIAVLRCRTVAGRAVAAAAFVLALSVYVTLP